MGWFSPDITTMNDLFVHTLQDIYYAEHQIAKALPDMAAKASDRELKKGFQMHLKQTRGQIKRLDQAFRKLKLKPQGTKCPAIDGIIDEANDIAGEITDKMVLNAALIAAAQAVAANLKEEKATDKKLNTIARTKINKKAMLRKPPKLDRRTQDAMLAAQAGIPAV